MSATTEGVTALLAKYNEALNASSTDAVMPLYAEDGVFMPPYSQSAVGAAAVRKAYDAVFNAITLNVKFTIAEIVEVGSDWAFARTNSAGTTTDHAKGRKSSRGQPGVVHLQKRSGRRLEDRALQLFADQSTDALVQRDDRWDHAVPPSCLRTASAVTSAE